MDTGAAAGAGAAIATVARAARSARAVGKENCIVDVLELVDSVMSFED